jgi:hypothetical protein
MSSSSEVQLVIDLQSIHDQQLIKSFNNPFRVEEPRVTWVILWSVGVVIVIGFYLANAQIEDIVIKITHNMFMSSDVHNMSGKHVCNFSSNSISPPTLHRKDNFTMVELVIFGYINVQLLLTILSINWNVIWS